MVGVLGDAGEGLHSSSSSSGRLVCSAAPQLLSGADAGCAAATATSSAWPCASSAQPCSSVQQRRCLAFVSNVLVCLSSSACLKVSWVLRSKQLGFTWAVGCR